MRLETYGDFCSGGGGMTIGAAAAGLKVVFGVEYEEKIAAVYRHNLGDHVIVADILTLDMETMPYVDVCHMSPPCPSFSVASTSSESETDIGIARNLARYIQLKRPRVVTLENVWQYRDSQSWATIRFALDKNGYQTKFWNADMADWGVPQNRQRMIVVARRDGIEPSLPPKTHTGKDKSALGVLSFFEDSILPPWIGWYQAIEDLIPYLPDAEFAPWQIKRLPAHLKDSFLPHTQANSGTDGRWGDSPATTAAGSKPPNAAFIVDSKNTGQEWGKGYRDEAQPSITVTALNRPSHMPRALVVDTANVGRDLTVRAEEEPYFTVAASAMRRPSNTAKAVLTDNPTGLAVLVSDQLRNGEDLALLDQDTPSMTVRAGGTGGAAPRAFIVPGGNSSSFSVRYDDEPARTVGDVERAGNAHGEKLTVREGDSPAMTVRAAAAKSAQRAQVPVFAVSQGRFGDSIPTREGDEPSATVTANSNQAGIKASVPVIVNTREMHDPDSGVAYTAREGDSPVYTIAATSNASRSKASVGYRVVEMTPRALARFQGFPDWYQAPASKNHIKSTGRQFVSFQEELLNPDSVAKTLACKIYGNAVPPLFSWQLYRHLIDQVS